MRHALLSILVLGALAACRGAESRPVHSARSGTARDSARADSASRARQDSINRAQPGYVVDSILPPEEDLRRFRAAFREDSATRFVGGEPSREALVRRFVLAVTSGDTTSLRAMAVHGREFADLYYPESPYSRPPYRQPVSFAWRTIQDPSSAGLSKLLRAVGGRPMAYLSHRCDPAVLHEGRTTRYAGCLVTLRDARGEVVTKRYFGSIVERDGQFKFLSYTNRF